MSLYRRHGPVPDWEPTPWDMAAEPADEQERGFHERAIGTIRWQPVPWRGFPAAGIFGHERNWFSLADIEFIASANGEDLLLIDSIWFGWPDPLQWGLASRPSGRHDVEWRLWGNFSDLPGAWHVPGRGLRQGKARSG